MRPKPALLIFRTSDDGLPYEEVTSAPGCWPVLCDGRPSNVCARKIGALTDYHRYKSCAFQHPGHAFNLCEQSRREHNTDRLTVGFVTGWTPATED